MCISLYLGFPHSLPPLPASICSYVKISLPQEPQNQVKHNKYPIYRPRLQTFHYAAVHIRICCVIQRNLSSSPFLSFNSIAYCIYKITFCNTIIRTVCGLCICVVTTFLIHLEYILIRKLLLNYVHKI